MENMQIETEKLLSILLDHLKDYHRMEKEPKECNKWHLDKAKHILVRIDQKALKEHAFVSSHEIYHCPNKYLRARYNLITHLVRDSKQYNIRCKDNDEMSRNIESRKRLEECIELLLGYGCVVDTSDVYEDFWEHNPLPIKLLGLIMSSMPQKEIKKYLLSTAPFQSCVSFPYTVEEAQMLIDVYRSRDLNPFSAFVEFRRQEGCTWDEERLFYFSVYRYAQYFFNCEKETLSVLYNAFIRNSPFKSAFYKLATEEKVQRMRKWKAHLLELDQSLKA